MAKMKKNATEGLNGSLAAVIRGELAVRGLKREDLAEKAGIPLDSLKNYLSTNPNRARMMDIELVASIAESLGMTSQALIAEAEERLRSGARDLFSDSYTEDDPFYVDPLRRVRNLLAHSDLSPQDRLALLEALYVLDPDDPRANATSSVSAVLQHAAALGKTPSHVALAAASAGHQLSEISEEELAALPEHLRVLVAAARQELAWAAAESERASS